MSESLYGAVDLSAFAAPAAPAGGQAQHQTAPQAGPSAQPSPTYDHTGEATVPGEYVIGVSAGNLRQVLETSASVPVVLYAHTERAEGSSHLRDALSQAVTALSGRVQLGIIDADTSPDVVQALGARGLPAAFAILAGQPVPLFEQVIESSQVPALLDQIIQAATQSGISGVLTGSGEVPLPPHMAEAYEALQGGDLATAEKEFHDALRENPGLEEAKTGLARIELLTRVEGNNPQDVLEQAKDAPLTDIETHILAADVEVMYNRPDAACARLLDVIRVTSGDERDKVREHLLKLFLVIGPGDLVNQARRALASALF